MARAIASDVESILRIRDASGFGVTADIFIGISALRLKVEGWTFEEVLEKLRRAARLAMTNDLKFRISLEDSSRAAPADLATAVSMVADLGADAATLCDTVGDCLPGGAGRHTAFVRERLDRMSASTEHYVVTDSDIELMEGCADLPDFYAFILQAFDVPVVGPMLRIDDLPDAYPLKKRVIEGHGQNYWSKTPIRVSWRSATVDVQHAVIDTTFGMYPARNPFRRRQQGIRTRASFLARHLDWYIDPENMTEDQNLYLRSSSAISHWGGSWLAKNLDTGQVPD